jgi:tRNA 2-thiouridine synthesizing protein E
MGNQTICFKEKVYTLDRHGFLDPAEQWDEEFAEGMAVRLGIYGGLTPQHWVFIKYLRTKFLSEDTVPVVVKACCDNHLKLTELRALFPTGYHRGACKIAGINFAFMCNTNLWLTYETPPPVAAEYAVDELGFLKDVGAWDERYACMVAAQWNMPDGLTAKHWTVIRYLRDYYRTNGTIPTVFAACTANSITLDELGRLFPGGYRRGACRAAGLPFFA